MSTKKCDNCNVINIQLDKQFCAQCFALKVNMLETIGEDSKADEYEEGPDPYYERYRNRPEEFFPEEEDLDED